MRGTIDALATEVPTIESDSFLGIKVSNFNLLNFDAVCGRMFLPYFTKQGIHQTSFTDFAFTNENKFSFVEGELRFGFGAQVCFDASNALFVCFGKFRVERIPAKIECI